MEILSYISYIFQKFNVYLVVLSRISALFSVFVIFRSDYVNARILLALSALLSLFVLLFDPQVSATSGNFSTEMIFTCIFQFFLGFFAGLILNIVFEIFQVAGQLISTQIGLSIDSLFDPRLGTITSLTRFYYIAVTLTFLLMNGHLMLLKTMLSSFAAFPIGAFYVPKQLLNEVVQYSAVMFTGGIGISLTIVLSMLLVNISLAIMTRFAPQFNVFSVGTNLSLVIGAFMIYLTFHFFHEKAVEYLTQGLDVLQNAFIKVK